MYAKPLKEEKKRKEKKRKEKKVKEKNVKSPFAAYIESSPANFAAPHFISPHLSRWGDVRRTWTEGWVRRPRDWETERQLGNRQARG